MRVLVRPALLALSTALILLAGPTPASAGGPTSVLIVNPTTGAAAALYTTDADYMTLLRALEPAKDGLAEDSPRLSAGPGTPAVNITWLVHDVSVWRVDQVRLDLDGVWVSTNVTSSDGSGISWQGDWHTAADPTAVQDVLDRLGILAGSGVASDVPSSDEPETALATSASGPFTGWWWAMPGALVGALIGIAVTSLRAPAMAALRRRESAPRHQLIDV